MYRVLSHYPRKLTSDMAGPIDQYVWLGQDFIYDYNVNFVYSASVHNSYVIEQCDDWHADL